MEKPLPTPPTSGGKPEPAGESERAIMTQGALLLLIALAIIVVSTYGWWSAWLK